MTEFNTLAEIQRNCKEIWTSTPDSYWPPVEVMNQLPVHLRNVDHPSEDFHIATDGVWYFVKDGMKSAVIYKLRNPELVTDLNNYL